MPSDPHSPRPPDCAAQAAVDIAAAQHLAERNAAALVEELGRALAAPLALARSGTDADRYRARLWVEGVRRSTEDRTAAAFDRLAALATYGQPR